MNKEYVIFDRCHIILNPLINDGGEFYVCMCLQ